MARVTLAVSLLLSIAFLSGCQGIQAVHAQATPVSLFNGRYMFKSSGWGIGTNGQQVPFTEAGTITADGKGGYVLDSYMNILDGGRGTPEHAIGTYSVDSTLAGTAQQTADSCNCPGPTDVQTLVISGDGSRAIMESKDVNFTWTAELTRD